MTARQMDRELLLEIGCEELPAPWLPALEQALGTAMESRLADERLVLGAPLETYSTPRRLVARAARLADRQSDLEEVVTGPPAAAAFRDGEATPAAAGFAKKHGVAVEVLERVETPRGVYVAVTRHQRGRAAAEILPAVLGGVLRDLPFPKNMRWDAWLDDDRGGLPFGRPIRWLLFLFGGRVVPFTIRRTPEAQSADVQEVRSAATTYGHRFWATSGRAGRAIRVRTFADYRTRLAEHCVVLEREERRDRIARELDAHARRVGGRVRGGAAGAALLQEVADLVECPSVVTGSFAEEFLGLPEEVLVTTMIHHQHYVPVADDRGRLLPAFLAVTNTPVDDARPIARNAERVLTARLRDACFFWDADRQQPLEARLDRLETVLFHQKLGSYRAKADRIEGLARWLAGDVLGRPGDAAAAGDAGRLAKADLATEMVRELTELQGVIGGVYAREDGHPSSVWRAIYHHYLPVAIEADAPPSAEALDDAAVAWAAVSLADKLDTVVGLFSVGERPTGTRDPFGIRRQLQGALRVLVDLPELTGLDVAPELGPLYAEAARRLGADPGGFGADLRSFTRDRLRHLFTLRGFRHDEIEAVLSASGDRMYPLSARRRLEALQSVRRSEDFEALAILFKRVKNLAQDAGADVGSAAGLDRAALTEPAEVALLAAFDERAPAIHRATDAGDYRRAMGEASALRPAVDRFFTDVFVMVEDARTRTARLGLLVTLRDLIIEIADISQLEQLA